MGSAHKDETLRLLLADGWTDATTPAGVVLVNGGHVQAHLAPEWSGVGVYLTKQPPADGGDRASWAVQTSSDTPPAINVAVANAVRDAYTPEEAPRP